MIEYELNCIGFFGFGGGYQLATAKRQPNRPLYCNNCTLAKACWEMHRDRVRKQVPELAAKIDAMQGDQKALHAWFTEGKPDPYIQVTLGNIEDGNLVGSGKSVKDRGLWTIPYPFKK